MNDTEKKKIISDHMAEVARIGHKKHPRPRSFYVNMRRKSKRHPVKEKSNEAQ